MKFVHEGVFTTGYYNAMEAGFPVFIDNEPIDDLFKAWLEKQGIPDNFCGEDWRRPGETFPHLGKRVRMTIELLDDPETP